MIKMTLINVIIGDFSIKVLAIWSKSRTFAVPFVRLRFDVVLW